MKIIFLVLIFWFRVFAQISGPEYSLLVIIILVITSQVYLQKLVYSGKKILILIQQQTIYYKNLSIASLSVFLWSIGGRSALKKVESNIVNSFLCKYIDLDVV